MRMVVLVAGLLMAGTLVLVGCNGDNTPTGVVRVLLGDAPLHLDDGTVVSAVNVTFTKVELLAGDEEDAPRATLFEGSTAVDLLTLANKPLAQLFPLAMADVPPGVYDQLRFIVDESASSVVVNGDPRPLRVASGPQTGLKVVDLGLTVAAGVTQVLLLEFDLTKLHENGQFLLTPNAVRAVCLSEAGSVTGTVALPAGAAPTSDVLIRLAIHLPGATEPLATKLGVLTADAPSATFVINGVPVGTYVVTGTASYGDQTASFDSPEGAVTAGGTLDLGTLTVTGLTF